MSYILSRPIYHSHPFPTPVLLSFSQWCSFSTPASFPNVPFGMESNTAENNPKDSKFPNISTDCLIRRLLCRRKHFEVNHRCIAARRNGLCVLLYSSPGSVSSFEAPLPLPTNSSLIVSIYTILNVALTVQFWKH